MSFQLEVSNSRLIPVEIRRFVLERVAKIVPPGEVSLSFVTNSEIRALNQQWRGKDSPTDVLSFSAREGQFMPGLENVLGDIVVSIDQADIQAKELGHGLGEEILVLVVHGLMHLQGYDHEKSTQDAQRQAHAEMELLAKIGVEPTIALCGREGSGFKMTRSRELILNVLQSQRRHLTADQVLALVRKKQASLGQATVYRTLKLFAQANLVKAHYFKDTEAVYEAVIDPNEHHDHLICERCEKIVEFENAQIEALQLSVAQQNRFKLTHHRMELYGVCGDCE